jgi:stage III sporulation protein AA
MNTNSELILADKTYVLEESITREDLAFCINAASRYSPWAAATTAKGYLTAPGGHRIGICGNSVCKDGRITGFREIQSLCIRIARDFPGISRMAGVLSGSILILGAPGWGKTTLLRDVCRRIGLCETVCVVDERGEVFPEGIERGKRLDVLTGCPKTAGIEMLLRTMSPSYIAVDEITAEEDCISLIQAANCGVHLIATAHGNSVEDLFRRKVYRELGEHSLFQTVLLLKPDKTYTVERMKPCISNGLVRY